ncbi:metallophosphoesterase family protein [Paenibacillus chondroitinus]|uniref:Metallophosphoesterase family protein n=1 Tax=Paenibacillus chondroitinus TaxID=59842 RepID=A0ABU6DQB2_9BACL|nr:MULTISPECIES: metallophosphoesterase family protein [Paenibacillus]MCY9662608.1 metallophosphoesterase family protein [Paenibacillus anseongense]MEB4799173.1 metallophosphoesterase family protein [Paenibacillus chondroitinus]
MQHQLLFREDQTFTITQFTDLHWIDGGTLDQKTRKLMEDVLDAEKPDLVVFTGDVIYTGYVNPGNPGCEQPLEAFREAVHAAETRGIPWAVVFGNHDTETIITREDLMQAVLKQPHTVTQRGPRDIHGTGNYALSIQGADGAAAAALYFFDSGNQSPVPHIQGYDWIRSSQIGWYVENSRKLQAENAEQTLPALAFFHIPLPEYKQVWDTEICYGSKHEPVCCAPVNSGLFSAMVERGDVIGTFCGHDHINDYRGKLHGIELCYGRATGYNTYGKEGFPRGARMIRLRQGERNFETWLRLADGTVVSEQAEHAPGE